MKKSQIFTSSIIIISLIAMGILFSYNEFYLRSKTKLSDHLTADEMQSMATNHLNALQDIIGSKLYFEKTINGHNLYFESYLNSNYEPMIILSKYKSLLLKNTQGIRQSYSFEGLENDLGNNFSKREAFGIYFTNNFSSNILTFENISSMDSIIIEFYFSGSLANLSACNNQLGGKAISIKGPSGYLAEFSRIDSCQMDLLASNGESAEPIIFIFSPQNISINYQGIDGINDLNIKASFNLSHENLFKTSTGYNNAGVLLLKGAYNLSKSLD